MFESRRVKPIGWDKRGVPAVYVENWQPGRWKAVVETPHHVSGEIRRGLLAEGDNKTDIESYAFLWLNDRIRAAKRKNKPNNE